jgi:hypothetical protein
MSMFAIGAAHKLRAAIRDALAAGRSARWPRCRVDNQAEVCSLGSSVPAGRNFYGHDLMAPRSKSPRGWSRQLW